ncbi:T9SS response regulator signal transducer PorX [Carboxylicivirga linearis]|uniref:Bifunctional response regulator/alkaline phosphatase family protein n=1 Tax=Carboxylicivirga linearis TaxID=1628157 RepID=A0ABS5JSE3_9BACT|nr:bifunctional response regulator/alkaline phosphatase family protein [Carboxylicivirga linearis]MBS2097777.1 bifunctional response regulator/alkaline phosphatase family protein [Carboxylicivirga linearis]
MSDSNIKILWVDDEIEHLRAHIMFLKEKGYWVETATNGQDALSMVEENFYDLIFLDENMPGLSGLETLNHLKELRSEIPVIMITKSEEEDIMDQAIGNKISDYLIKPVNPRQILLSIKKNLNTKELVTKTTTSGYQSQFGQIALKINDSFTFRDWVEVYKRIIYWELELEQGDGAMDEVLRMQKNEANQAFTKFIKKEYLDWLNEKEEAPLMSHQLVKNKVLPLLDQGKKVFFIVIDNFRYDQWEVLKRVISSDYLIEDEAPFYSILPTATQYARNSIFSGLLPTQIKKMYPQYWVDEDVEEGKNQYEGELLGTLFERFRKKASYSYHKISDNDAGKNLLDNLHTLLKNDLNAIVFNFVDMLSHARTEVKMIKELARDEAAYRSLTLSWFNHSALKELLQRLKEEDVTIVLTTDHGTTRAQNPVKVIGDRNVNTNLRYKQGKNLAYKAKEVFEIKQPEKAFLPKLNVSSTYIFACQNDFFAYPNNYNHYVSYYRDTFQHGGISLEEMIIPCAQIKGRK